MARYEVVHSRDRLPHIARAIERSSAVGFDIETVGMDPMTGKLRLLSLRTEDPEEPIFVLDYFSLQDFGPVLEALKSEKVVKIAHNAKYEQKWMLYLFAWEIWPLFDSYRASVLIHNGWEDMRHDLRAVEGRELHIHHSGKDLGGSDWSGALTEEQYAYSAGDSEHLIPLRYVLKQKLTRHDLNWLAFTEFGSILPESATELAGMPFNKQAWLNLRDLQGKRAEALRQEVIAEVPAPTRQLTMFGLSDFNLDSTQQVLAALQKMGVKAFNPADKKRELIPSTNKNVMMMAAAEHPIVRKVLDYRKAKRRFTSFGDNFFQHIHPLTGRIHCQYYPFLLTGRFAPNNPNLGAIPRESEYRACFEAEPGRKMILADYSAIELRFVAELSRDPTLCRLFREKIDPHAYTAAVMTSRRIEEIGKKSKERQAAKPVNFGLCVAEGQRVLTHVGLVPIEKVEGWHLVWDGIEWVSHDGVIFMGEREVLSFDGLTLTPDHEVYTDAGSKVPFQAVVCSSEFGPMAVGGIGGSPVGYDTFDLPGGGKTSSWPGFRGQRGQKGAMAKVYDLRNAGPRHRFTVEGKVVSNCFGMQPEKLVIYAMADYGVAMTIEEATTYRERYFERYDGIRRWQERALRDGKRTKISRSVGGRLRHMDEDEHNEFFNHPIQASNADGLKRALREVHMRFKKLPDTRIIHHVHDEIIAECPDDPEIAEAGRKALEEGMIAGMLPLLQHTPVEVEAVTGSSWASKA